MSDVLPAKIETEKKLNVRMGKKKQFKVTIPRGYGRKQLDERWKMLNNKNTKYKEYKKNNKLNMSDTIYKGAMEEILDKETLERCDIFKDNIENFIGTVKVPLGVAGPLLMNGLHAQGEYYIPLATTEAALIASLNRGIQAINLSGGCSAAVVKEGISRDPGIVFSTLLEAGKFVNWAKKNFKEFKAQAETTTRYGKLQQVKYTMAGNNVHMKCIYTTGDAAGQNIVTIATEKICEWIMKNSPIKPVRWFLEAGMSCDKKANASTMSFVRGKKVICEVTIPKKVCWSVLHATPKEVVLSGTIGMRGLILAGSIGMNCHFSNAITALSMALGQDPACASEAHIGLMQAEVNKDGDLYFSGTLPNILVGTVGGGTKLPSQRACLELMGLYGSGNAHALAEIFGAVCLAGELSLGAAIISGDFARAHKLLARENDAPIDLKVDTVEQAFEKAQSLVIKLSKLPSRDVILDIYGLFKQGTVGNVNIDKPGIFSDLKAKAKYNSWKAKKGMKKEEAQRKYVDIVLGLVEKEKKEKTKK